MLRLQIFFIPIQFFIYRRFFSFSFVLILFISIFCFISVNDLEEHILYTLYANYIMFKGKLWGSRFKLIKNIQEIFVVASFNKPRS